MDKTAQGCSGLKDEGSSFQSPPQSLPTSLMHDWPVRPAATNEEKRFSHLPEELKVRISRSISLEEYVGFRLIDRACRSLAPLRFISPVEHLDLRLPSSSPMLVGYRRAKPDSITFVDSKPSREFTVQSPSELHGRRIRHANNGWLLFWKKCKCHLFHPATGETIMIMDNRNNKFGITDIVFTDTPYSDDWLVVGMELSTSIVAHEPVKVGIFFIREGRKVWTSCDLMDHSDFMPSCNSPAYFKGSFYYLDVKGRLLVVDIDHELGWELDKCPCPSLSFAQNYLVACDE